MRIALCVIVALLAIPSTSLAVNGIDRESGIRWSWVERNGDTSFGTRYRGLMTLRATSATPGRLTRRLSGRTVTVICRSSGLAGFSRSSRWRRGHVSVKTLYGPFAAGHCSARDKSGTFFSVRFWPRRSDRPSAERS